MNKTPRNTWSNYNENSERYFNEYKKNYFSKIHRQFLKYLPYKIKSSILDIGCGSGRDAHSLAKRGYLVTAVDPSTEMLRLAKTKNSHPNINWLNDSLPQLKSLEENTYDFILLSAVWMHIPANERGESLGRLYDLLTENGRLAITLRIGQPDPERMMYPISLEELLMLASQKNLTPIYTSRENRDSFNRSNIFWRKIILEKTTHNQKESIRLPTSST